MALGQGMAIGWDGSWGFLSKVFCLHFGSCQVQNFGLWCLCFDCTAILANGLQSGVALLFAASSQLRFRGSGCVWQRSVFVLGVSHWSLGWDLYDTCAVPGGMLVHAQV